jgi:hypothetical protein
MQFSLPSNLQQQLLAYDPELKKLVREQKQTSPKAKPKYPLGNVNDLIPFHIVSASKQQDASDYINSHSAEHRIYKFTKFVNIEVDGVKAAEEVVHAFIYHFESNARLTDQQRAEYQEAFGLALQELDKQLESA